ncbi:coatomer protein complex, subunit alpha (xenin) [Angomonas deanei]|uniref:Coatomer WD associated region/Coatomer (COPI) alpha subunit C-terminus, putative n=1 Tax=Angomonas deanei TaxID=59799 RepID=S9V6K7_9TRYP|nr:coatomer protein complex, subunit alpha (xenin) [Angomonas deanei]EPY36473.1 coatomer protein complex, subunit alpha (xenin) [Angomonas deanei]CAD2214759.1 Coatomer WD associated region/Coatomer (COPI) alpha subunit C-terminus, putative [Angomonas deanei]|eukprot:EPY33627.1 coatomer protein complex, subunit alpha (xenin) [Angomonas deanei]
MTFRRELDRYWILATYASKNLIAAGHDTGLQVFKLFRERPPFAVSQNQLTYIHENQLFVYDFKSESDTKFNLPGKMLRPPYALSVNPSASQIVVCLKDDSNYVDLIDIPKAGFSASLKAPNRKTDVTEATFFGPNKYVYIDANGGLFMHSLTGEKDKSLGVPFVCTKLFPAPTGCVLCQSEENIYIYQVAQHASIAEAPAVGTRQAVWDKGFHKVALLSKNAIEIRTKRLKLITTVRELTSRIKSAVFDETRDVLFYTTSNHIKYCILRTGEVSTICTLKTVVYLVAAVGDKVWMLTRSGKVLVKELDNLELNFKLKLQQQSFREVMKIIQSRELKGQALVGYLHKHNYSEIALHFAKEPLTRFNLALECGAIDIAKEAAMELDDASVWRRLSETAITFGDIQLSQLADSKANNYHASAMHMLYTGNLSALGHLVDSVQDDNFKLQYGLYLNDYEQRIQLLLNANQLPLAYLTAKSNGLEEVAANIYSKMSDEVKKNIDQTECPKSDPSPKPTPQTDNWPMLQVEESIFTKLLKQTGELDVLAANVEELDDDAADAWGDGDDDDLFKEMDEEGDSPLQGAPEEAEGDGWDDDLDIDVNAVLKSAAGTKSDAGFVVPPALPPISTHWVETSTVAAFHVAAGQFTSAFHLLKGQIGLKDPAPLKKEALLLWSSVNVSRPAWLTSSVSFSLTAAGSSATNSKHIPRVPNYMPHLLDTLKSGYQAFTDGRFDDAHALFRSILHKCVFTVVSNDQELASFRDLLSVAAEYTRALAVQLQLRSSEASSQEALELSLYLTHFQLQRPHMILGLSQAMSKAYKRKNFRTAASVARRLVDLDPPEKRAKQAAAIIAEADKNPVDADELKYDERNPFTLCSESYTPIYKGTLAVVRCGYCLSGVAPTHDGKVCGVCGVSSYGAQCAGLINQV